MSDRIVIKSLPVDGGEIGIEVRVGWQEIALDIKAIDRAWVSLSKQQAQGLVNRLEEAIGMLEADDE